MPPTPMDRSYPAARVRHARKWLGLTPDGLGAVLGLSARSVANFEAHGAPGWVCYALFGWTVLVHGATPRAAARHLGLAWQQFPLPQGPAPDGVSADPARPAVGRPSLVMPAPFPPDA